MARTPSAFSTLPSARHVPRVNNALLLGANLPPPCGGHLHFYFYECDSIIPKCAQMRERSVCSRDYPWERLNPNMSSTWYVSVRWVEILDTNRHKFKIESILESRSSSDYWSTWQIFNTVSIDQISCPKNECQSPLEKRSSLQHRMFKNSK